MTKAELLAMSHLSVAEIKRFVHIHSEEGYVICNVPDDMRDYIYTNCLYLPIKDEYDEYKVVDLEENAANEAYRQKLEEEDKEKEAEKEEILSIILGDSDEKE